MGRRREVIGWAIAAVAVLLGDLLVSGEAHAADIRLRAAGECAERSDIADQVDGLLGRPVGEVQGLDFDVDIRERPDGGWRLRLVTTGRADGAKRSREIDGAGCAQLADAAAVAIAMSIQSNIAGERAANTAGGSAPPDPPVVAVAPRQAAPQGVQLSLGIGPVADVGALPHPSFGVGLGAALAGRRLVVIGEGSLFASPEARLPDNSGGSFRLLVGAALACFAERLGPTGILVCGGGEAGVVQAEGVGVNRPRLQNIAWGAGRLELGLTRRLNDTFSLFIRGGVAIPWPRPTFTVNNDKLVVHRSEVMTGRIIVGALFKLF